jgi:hypothetical protein
VVTGVRSEERELVKGQREEEETRERFGCACFEPSHSDKLLLNSATTRWGRSQLVRREGPEAREGKEVGRGHCGRRRRSEICRRT